MRNTSIRTRLIIMVILIATVPIVFSTIIATNNIRDFSTRENINANMARISWGATYLDELIAQLDRMFYSLQINDELGESIQNLGSDNVSERFDSQIYATDTMATAYYANSRKIDELIYYSDSIKQTFAVSYKVLGDIRSLDQLEAYWGRLETSDTNIYFEPYGKDIYAVHSLNRFQDQKMYGGLAVRVVDDVWEEMLRFLEPVGQEKVFILNDEYELVAGTGDRMFLNGFLTMLEDEADGEEVFFHEAEMIVFESQYYFVQDVDESKLRIVKSVPISQIRAGEINTIRAAILIMVLTILVAVILSIIFSFRVSKPIVELAKTMRSADLEGLEIANRQSIDEVDLLENGYLQMVQRLKDLIQEEYQHEIELKNAQLLALQAQINPHFLNNTLNLIGGMALEKDAPEIYDMARSISDLLRYSVKDSDELVSLGDELKHVSNYLKIQQKRYEGRCSVNYDLLDGVADLLVPKFILQPIVENAFEYGLQPKVGEWRLDIRVFKAGIDVGIAVRDNGVGMSEERLTRLREQLDLSKTAELNSRKYDRQPLAGDNKGGTGIGLKNVAMRLKLKFNEKSGIRVFSKEGKGTMVVLVVRSEERRRRDV